MPIIDSQSDKQIRPPVVVVLGHVDHGKTTLLDTIRNTRVVAKESGGITQHIGAYQTEYKGKTITFLDTPGHEAFSSIRSRGTKVADIAVLVVAADEGVKPQTKEAIDIIKSEEIPFVVAINKIDKESQNIQKLKQELAAEEVLVEDWGGKVPVVEISAKHNKNIDDLLDMILLVADLEDLKNDLTLPAEGVLIESYLDKRRGYVATVLLKKGILNIGDWVAAGPVIGKIKSMEDFAGKPINEVFPSQPAMITGWMNPPGIGMTFKSALSKDEALQLSAESTDITQLFKFFKNSDTGTGDKKILNVIFKSDVTSSLEAIEAALSSIKSDLVSCKVLGYDVGNITDSDIKIALNSKAKVYGFRVNIEDSAKRIAEKEGIEIKSFDIIYELIESVRKDMAGILEPEIKANVIGKMRVLAIFKSETSYQIVGGKVTSGKILRGALAEVVRNDQRLSKGKITQLQHNKEDTTEVKEGLEAGIKYEFITSENFEGIKEGDILEIYQEEKIAKTV